MSTAIGPVDVIPGPSSRNGVLFACDACKEHGGFLIVTLGDNCSRLCWNCISDLKSGISRFEETAKRFAEKVVEKK